jgi:uncharacterized protein (DUF983 family)
MNKYFYHSIVGTIVPILGVITSFQQQIEYWLRVSGLVVGLIVGILSAWQLIKKL